MSERAEGPRFECPGCKERGIRTTYDGQAFRFVEHQILGDCPTCGRGDHEVGPCAYGGTVVPDQEEARTKWLRWPVTCAVCCEAGATRGQPYHVECMGYPEGQPRAVNMALYLVKNRDARLYMRDGELMAEVVDNGTTITASVAVAGADCGGVTFTREALEQAGRGVQREEQAMSKGDVVAPEGWFVHRDEYHPGVAVRGFDGLHDVREVILLRAPEKASPAARLAKLEEAARRVVSKAKHPRCDKTGARWHPAVSCVCAELWATDALKPGPLPAEVEP